MANAPVTAFLETALKDIAWFLNNGGSIKRLGLNVKSHRLIGEHEMGAAGTLILVPVDPDTTDCEDGLTDKDIKAETVQIAVVVEDNYWLLRESLKIFDELPLDEYEVYFRLYNDFQEIIDKFRLELSSKSIPTPTPVPARASTPAPAMTPTPVPSEWDAWIRGG